MMVQADEEAVEMGGEIFHSELNVAALLTTVSESGAYCLFMDLGTLLYLVTDPYLDFEGVMAVENACTKANVGLILGARVSVAYQVCYPQWCFGG